VRSYSTFIIEKRGTTNKKGEKAEKKKKKKRDAGEEVDAMDHLVSSPGKVNHGKETGKKKDLFETAERKEEKTTKKGKNAGADHHAYFPFELFTLQKGKGKGG